MSTDKINVTIELTQLDRIEAKLDALLEALAVEAEEQEEKPLLTLDGDEAGGERDQSQSLG